MGRSTPAEAAPSPAPTLTLSGKTLSTATTCDANASRPGAEPLSPRRLGAPRGTTGCGSLPGLKGSTRAGAGDPCAAPSVGCSARAAAFPAFTRATPGCRSAPGAYLVLLGPRASKGPASPRADLGGFLFPSSASVPFISGDGPQERKVTPRGPGTTWNRPLLLPRGRLLPLPTKIPSRWFGSRGVVGGGRRMSLRPKPLIPA